ncbi:MAG: serine/threonine-protein kinase, partial [Gemmatimonadales bacterium]
MNAERWDRVQDLFHRAVDLPETARDAFLAEQCRDDPSLVPEVKALLAADAREHTPVDRPVAAVARELLGTAPPDLSAHRFGPYRIASVLGEGGMGVVYLGVRDDLDTKVAIKILRDAWLSPARRERFASEERLLARLSHPAIAALHDAGTLPDGTPWFVMEYVEGVPINEYCRNHASSLGERLRLFRSVCEAVRHAHRHAIVHRDLKPSNVLVTNDRRVKLLDFGIAKQLETFDDPAVATRTGLRMMTPAYAAPEQFRGTGIGLYTDIYSLGVLLYELLAGKVPYDLTDKNSAEAAAMVAAGDALKPSAAARLRAPTDHQGAGRSVGTDLDVLCLKAMHPDPERRYPSVEALIRDIDHFLDGEPLEARPDAIAYRLTKFASRNLRAVTIGLGALAVVAVLVAFYTVRLAAARDRALAEAARTERIQEFTMRLFEGGDESVGPADSLRVVSLLDRGLRDARSLDADPAAQSELYLTLGTISQKLGNLERADTLLNAAVSKRRALLGNDHEDVAAALIELSALQSAKADFPTALATAHEAVAIASRTTTPAHPVRARALAAL